MTCGNIDFACTRCRLSKSRTQVVAGTGPCSATIVFIGEAPGKEEDLRGEPFVGRAGKLLDKVLSEAGSDRSQVFICNLVKCRPPGNRRPRKDEIEACSRFLRSELETVKPRVVCLLGQTVANNLLKRKGMMADIAGTEVDASIAGIDARIFVAYHPAACLYQRRNLGSFRRSIEVSLRAAKKKRRHASE